MALHVHRSNRIERLAGRLADVVREPLGDPLQRECVVVQGPGMERWLSAYLSRSLGVWANPWFPFPRALLELFLNALLGDEGARFTPEQLTFRIARQLGQRLDAPAFREVRAYLARDVHDQRLVELSRRLAENFDQYAVYRPELVLGWERGEATHFQAELMRALTEASGARHLAGRLHAFERALAAGATLAERTLPERISLFGISTLPPPFLRIFARIAAQMDVHLFLLTPSREYWGDLDRTQRTRSDLHGFLAELGKLSREFLELLEGESYIDDAEELFVAPGHGTLLHALQSDLMELTARDPRGSAGEQPVLVDRGDRSVRVHVCHSIVRELEVLRDQLRARFERDATLEARDVVVFTPDIERYAPAIEAVFGEQSGGHAIPFRIADRRAGSDSEVAEAFRTLLTVIQSRLHVSDALDLLQRPSVRARFDIAESELERAEQWLARAGARWAIDGAHRGGFGQPPFHENSLRFALERLMVGFAAADGEQRALHGVLPWSGVEGHDALLLGKVASFLEQLFAAVRTFATPAPVGVLAQRLIALLATMISDADELAVEHHALRSALAELASDAESAGYEGAIELATMCRLFEKRLELVRGSVGFLSGGVTFCEPVPMRAIPFRVVCLLGLDDESFPRSVSRPAFDLMSERPRAGDRSLRDDDRQLFLEALLSARDALHLSYIGRSAQEGSERPASVVIDHLLRVCDRHFVMGDGKTLSLGFEGPVSEQLTEQHALHRFDARYFRSSSAQFSYDEAALRAAAAMFAPKQLNAPFVAAPLPPVPTPLTLTLAELTRFFRRPHELFMRERLNLQLPRELAQVATREPIMLDALERFRLADELLEQQGLAPEERERLLVGAGRLGPGSVGAAQLEQLESLVAQVVAAAPDSPALPDRELAIELPSGRVGGKLVNLTQEALLVRSVGTLHVKRLLTAYIEHLALCASGAEPRCTLVIGRDGKSEVQRRAFRYVEDARAQLEALLGLYRVGMSMPLPLFHDAADCYARELAKDAEPSRALGAAQSKLSARGQISAVLDDPHVLQLFSREQLLDLPSLRASDGTRTVGFIEVAELLFVPMVAHMEKR